MLFHPKLYKDKLKLKSVKALITEFNKLLKAQYPNIKPLTNSILKRKDNTVLFPHKIMMIKLNKPLNNNNIISILILENPILYEQQEVQIVILFSCLDNNRYIYNNLLHIFNKLSLKPDEIEGLLKKPSYAVFLSLIKENQ